MIRYYELDGNRLSHKREVAQLGQHFYEQGEAIKTKDNKEEYYHKILRNTCRYLVYGGE